MIKEIMTCGLLVLSSVTVTSADESVLHLKNGDFVPGKLLGSDQPTVLRWKSSSFAQPLDFLREHVDAIHYSVPAELPKPQGEYCVELNSGDVMFGDLVGLTESSIELDSKRFGRVHFKRDQLCRLYRWDQGAELIYLGPNGLDGWTESPSKERQWRSAGGLPTTDKPGTHIRGDFRLPPQAAIEFELSWTKLPNFVLALGVDDSDADTVFNRAFRFEVWDTDLVVGCEQAREADVEAVETLQPGAGSIHLVAFLDQHAGKLMVYSPSGQRMAQVGVTPRKKEVYSGLRLANKQGDVRLDRLRISRWDGVPPPDVLASKSRLQLKDGSTLYGKPIGYEAEAKRFNVEDENGKTKTLDAADVLAVLSGGDQRAAESKFCVAYQDGTRISGELTEISDGAIDLKSPDIEKPLRLPLEDLRSIVLPSTGVSSTESILTTGMARLELQGVRLHGKLAEAEEQPGASCLSWHPRTSLTASPLVPGLSGRIVYREPPPPPTQRTITTGGQPFVRILVAGNKLVEPIRKAPASSTSKSTSNSKMLHLRSGDAIPCEVSRIDESGITFTSPVSEAQFVPHAKVKAVELMAGQPLPKLTKEKRARLLTLPRLQKDSPPTHLVCLVRGDILRGRLVGMDEKVLHLEVRLEVKEVSRFQVSRIIWLHPDELSPEPAAQAETLVTPSKTRVQAVRSDGIRLTYFPERYADDVLSGTSDVLGACRTDELLVDQLLIGTAIEQATTQLAYHRWKLHPAVEPKVAELENDAGAGATSGGTESPLVGKPAPSFELPLLNGKSFRLTESRGNILVLDFWASWCGPCMQSMPQVEEVVREFSDAQVQLLAVNLEEPAAQITSTLERHKLQIPVALDRNGVVSAKFDVSAIPQTVIIDRQGNVARLFIGGGSKFPDQLRAALRELLAADAKKAS